MADSLKDAIVALRSQVAAIEGIDGAVLASFDQLGQQADLYTGLDPQAARTALDQLEQFQAQDSQLQTVATERDQLSTQLNETQVQLVNTQKQFAALRGLTSAGIRPEYEEILLPQVASQLELAEDGAVQVPEGTFDGLKQKYPAMFFADDAAGTGGAAGGGGPAPEGPQQVTTSNGVVSGVNPDAVLDGSVHISMGA